MSACKQKKKNETARDSKCKWKSFPPSFSSFWCRFLHAIDTHEREREVTLIEWLIRWFTHTHSFFIYEKSAGWRMGRQRDGIDGQHFGGVGIDGWRVETRRRWRWTWRRWRRSQRSRLVIQRHGTISESQQFGMEFQMSTLSRLDHGRRIGRFGRDDTGGHGPPTADANRSVEIGTAQMSGRMWRFTHHAHRQIGSTRFGQLGRFLASNPGDDAAYFLLENVGFTFSFRHHVRLLPFLRCESRRATGSTRLQGIPSKKKFQFPILSVRWFCFVLFFFSNYFKLQRRPLWLLLCR